MIRRILFSLVCLGFLVPVALRADTFTFTPSSGTGTYTFTLGTTADQTFSNQGNDAAMFNADNGNLTLFFYNQGYSDYYNQNGYGQVDMQFIDHASNQSYLLVGPILFTGDVNHMQFTQGTYTLASSPQAGVQGGGILTVTAETPEPSSLALLGTGLLVVAARARRNFMAA